MSKGLRAAIVADDAEGVKAALRRVKNVNKEMDGGWPAIISAAEWGKAKVIDVLLDAGASVEGSHPGGSAWAFAAEKGHVHVLEKLSARLTPTPDRLDAALGSAAMRGQIGALRYLLERFEPKVGALVMHLAEFSSNGEVIKALVEHGGDPNARHPEPSGDGLRPLHAAAIGGRTRAIAALVENGADVNGRDDHGRAPLMLCVTAREMLNLSEENRQTLEMAATLKELPENGAGALLMLLRLGADAALVDEAGNDVLMHYAWEAKRDRSEAEPALVEVLKKGGAKGGGATWELFEAIWDNDVARAKKAIGAGADVNHVGPMPIGGTPLGMATSEERREFLEMLLEAGADVNKAGRHGPPLILAAGSGEMAVVKRLIEAGADVHAMEPARKRGDADAPRMNALLAAEMNRKFEVVDYLKSLGAGKPKPASAKAMEAGVSYSWSFEELLVKADVKTTARALAKVIGGRVIEKAYGKSFAVGERFYVVARPRGMAWSNVLLIQERQPRHRGMRGFDAFAKDLSSAAGAPALWIGYSDTSGTASVVRYDGAEMEVLDEGWDEGTLDEVIGAMEEAGEDAGWAKEKKAKLAESEEAGGAMRPDELAKKERFVAGAFGLDYERGRKLDVEFTGYSEQQFDGVALVTA